jgi:rhodanese-related sulfurtransferase
MSTSESVEPEVTTPVRTLEAVRAAVRVTQGAHLIDVRSDAGRDATGAIPHATIADRNDLDAIFGAVGAPVIALDQPVVVVCGSEKGSAPVVAALRERGYTDVVHVAGGFPAWRDAGLPVTPGGPRTDDPADNVGHGCRVDTVRVARSDQAEVVENVAGPQDRRTP